MTRKEALTDLLAKLEAGFDPENRPSAFKALRDPDHAAWALKAHKGSLDAAKALHEAVLPGWDRMIATHEDDTFEASVAPPLKVKTYDGVSQCMARAWLIAIIKALIAQEESA